MNSNNNYYLDIRISIRIINQNINRSNITLSNLTKILFFSKMYLFKYQVLQQTLENNIQNIIFEMLPEFDKFMGSDFTVDEMARFIS